MVASIAAFLSGCSKNEEPENLVKLSFNLTDAPAGYDQLNIEILGVQVIIDDSIYDLDTQSGIYNLLDLVNGKDTLLAEQEVPTGMLSQVRLILGENNNLLIGEDTYDLKTPSAQQSGLKLNVHKEFLPGIAYEYTIDFDAGRSIVNTGNDNYILKPVLRVYAEAVSGAIEGVVSPPEARPFIYAISGSKDTSSTYADTLTGRFMFKGLSEGIYNLEFMPIAPFNDTTLTEISVSNGSITEPDTLKFQ